MHSRILSGIALNLLLLGFAHAQDVRLKIIAINDFHGYVESPGSFRASAQMPEVRVGGVDFLAGYVADLERENSNHIVVSAGDLTGASPLTSALFHDEDTIEAMNRLGLELNAVGNHEFDHGPQELMRLQHGGCSTEDANTCNGASTGTPVPFEGAKFKYLAANVVDTATGKTIFPAYEIKSYGGIKVAFLGLTLKDTPSNLAAGRADGLRFDDEATTINAIVARLREQGVQSFVILIHQGGRQTSKGIADINACEGGLAGTPIQSVVSRLDDAVDLVISAHTHLAYICKVANRNGRPIPVTSAGAFGRLLTNIDVTLNRKTGDVTAISARNLLVDRANPSIHPDPAVKSLVDRYAILSAPIVNRQIGSIEAGITKAKDDRGESALGDLIADAQLDATSPPDAGGAVIAFMNTDGVRSDIPFDSGVHEIPPGKVTYGEIFAVQPFRNVLVTMTLTGAQIATVLEEQFKGCALGAPPGDAQVPAGDRWLAVSHGFTYTIHASAEPCHKVDPRSMKLNGVLLDPSAPYRVTMNSFLADGGSMFPVFRQGTARRNGPPDLDALLAHFASHPSISANSPSRIALEP